MNSYVEDILDLGRIEGHGFQLNMSHFLLQEVIDEVKDIFELELNFRRLTLNVEIDQELKSLCITTDKDRLKQVIINLLSNAIKF